MATMKKAGPVPAKPLHLPNVTRMGDQSLRDLCGRANQRIVEHGDDRAERNDAAATYHNAYMVWHRAQAELMARAGATGDELQLIGVLYDESFEEFHRLAFVLDISLQSFLVILLEGHYLLLLSMKGLSAYPGNWTSDHSLQREVT